MGRGFLAQWGGFPARPTSMENHLAKTALKNSLTLDSYPVFSEQTEAIEHEKAQSSPAKVHPPLGGDGDALGHQPHRGADSRAAVHFAEAAQRRGLLDAAWRGPFQRQLQPQGIASVGNHQA